jgi:hypothetical protein
MTHAHHSQAHSQAEHLASKPSRAPAFGHGRKASARWHSWSRIEPPWLGSWSVLLASMRAYPRPRRPAGTSACRPGASPFPAWTQMSGIHTSRECLRNTGMRTRCLTPVCAEVTLNTPGLQVRARNYTVPIYQRKKNKLPGIGTRTPQKDSFPGSWTYLGVFSCRGRPLDNNMTFYSRESGSCLGTGMPSQPDEARRSSISELRFQDSALQRETRTRIRRKCQCRRSCSVLFSGLFLFHLPGLQLASGQRIRHAWCGLFASPPPGRDPAAEYWMGHWRTRTEFHLVSLSIPLDWGASEGC